MVSYRSFMYLAFIPSGLKCLPWLLFLLIFSFKIPVCSMSGFNLNYPQLDVLFLNRKYEGLTFSFLISLQYFFHKFSEKKKVSKCISACLFFPHLLKFFIIVITNVLHTETATSNISLSLMTGFYFAVTT